MYSGHVVLVFSATYWDVFLWELLLVFINCFSCYKTLQIFFCMLAFVLWVITSYLVISNIMRTSVAVLCIVALQLQMGSGELAQKNIVFFFM